MESNKCLHSPLRLSYSVGRPRLSRHSRYDMAGEIMESALFSFYILTKISRGCVMENRSAVF